jgi:hypothetical protein
MQLKSLRVFFLKGGLALLFVRAPCVKNNGSLFIGEIPMQKFVRIDTLTRFLQKSIISAILP